MIYDFTYNFIEVHWNILIIVDLGVAKAPSL